MFPTKKIPRIFRKPLIPEQLHLCKHKVLVLKESNNFHPFIEQHMIKINREYHCVDCDEIFKVIPSKMRMVKEPMMI